MIQNAYQYCEECKYLGIGKVQPEFVFQMPTDEVIIDVKKIISANDFKMTETCEECKFFNKELFFPTGKITCSLTDADLSNEDSYQRSDTCPLMEV